jgi:hypothetical protein
MLELGINGMTQEITGETFYHVTIEMTVIIALRHSGINYIAADRRTSA